MTPDLQQAIALAQSGQREAARALLLQVLEVQPRSEAAWLWLASVAKDEGERVSALRRVLGINPSNQAARAALEKLGQPLPALTPLAEAPTLGGLRVGWIIAGIFVAVMVLALVFIAFSLLAEGTGGAETPTATPSFTFVFVPTASPTASFTPSRTPTDGPSPTPPIPATLLATWTPRPSATLPPTRTLAPTSTFIPTRTAPPTFTPTLAPSETPVPPTETPSRTPRP